MAKTEKELQERKEKAGEPNREPDSLSGEELELVSGGKLLAQAGKTIKVVRKAYTQTKE